MSCPWRHNPGSGFDKPCDPVLAKANKDALERLRAERAAQDARAAPTPASSGKKLTTEPPKQRYVMKGD